MSDDQNVNDAAGEYGADNLQHLSDRDHVRKRPGCTLVTRLAVVYITWFTK